jgi:hypothetical protein
MHERSLPFQILVSLLIRHLLFKIMSKINNIIIFLIFKAIEIKATRFKINIKLLINQINI